MTRCQIEVTRCQKSMKRCQIGPENAVCQSSATEQEMFKLNMKNTVGLKLDIFDYFELILLHSAV